MLQLRRTRALLGCAAGALVMISTPVSAAGSYSAYDESASAALARYVRTLAASPNDFQTLISAGRAALAVGDTQAAAGFFARADDVNPRSPLPQAGMGAVFAANGDPQTALSYFVRAQQLGASVAQIACDRGLAFDLLGRQADAQSDYRIALNGPDAEETRRRLALSFAISGDRQGALSTLAPLLAKRDPAAARTRAFILALTGDSAGAMAAFDAAMPGTWARISPFLKQLPVLAPGQKAAAVNLGIFTEGSTALASVSAPTQPLHSGGAVNVAGTSESDRLAGIDALLSRPAQPAPSNMAAPQYAQAAPAPTVASYFRPQPSPAQQPSVAFPPRKIWLQLASGSNPGALPSQFQRLKSRHRDLFEGINGYVATSSDRARLLIGPFRSASDADTFAEDLETVAVNAFRWSNSEADRITPLRVQ